MVFLNEDLGQEKQYCFYFILCNTHTHPHTHDRHRDGKYRSRYDDLWFSISKSSATRDDIWIGRKRKPGGDGEQGQEIDRKSVLLLQIKYVG